MISLRRLNASLNMSTTFKRCISISTTLRNNNANLVKNNQYNKLGFIGTGNMARAIIQGLIMEKKFLPEQIYVSDSDEDYFENLKNNVQLFKDHKINFTNNNDIFKQTNNIMLCVKPQDMHKVLVNNSNSITENHLLISIAAGVQLEKLQNCLVNPARIIRIMTNTAALIQQGCSVYAKGENATDDDALFVNNLLKLIGTSEGEIKESQMDVVTALSGSGPAYMFLILDSLADGANMMGLDKDMAVRLATQTMLGAATMVMKELNDSENGKHIMQMKEEVCSPGGTTINGIAQLEKHNVRSALINCIEEATKRSAQLNIS